MDNQKLAIKLDHYWMTKVCHAAPEGLEMQGSQEDCSGTEECFRATALHKLRAEEIINLSTKNLQAERYFAKYCIIFSVSARSSNQFLRPIASEVT